MKRDIHQEVTDRIIEQMQTAGRNWLKPFIGSAMPRNGVTKKQYNGINVFMLMLFGQSSSNEFASYKQWQTIGGQVIKGSTGIQIVFFKSFTSEKENKTTGKMEKSKWAMLRYSTVFSREQVEGLPAIEVTDNSGADTIAACEEYLLKTAATIKTEANKGAFYYPTADYICMPPKSDFLDTDCGTATEHYYSVAFHELTHWTGNKSRLDRMEDKNKRGYAFEELIAEMGAAIQCATLGIDNEPRDDHAKYLNSWLKYLADDSKAIFKAAAQAQKAVSFIEALQTSEPVAQAA